MTVSEFDSRTLHHLLGSLMRECNICRGERRVRLPVYQDLAVASYDPDLTPSPSESWRQFPCPACSNMVPSERLYVMQEMRDFPIKQDPGFIEHVQRSLASALAGMLLKRGFIKFEDGQADQYRMTRAVIASVNVVGVEVPVPERTVRIEMPPWTGLSDPPSPPRPKKPRPPRLKKPKPEPRNPFGRVIDL